MPLALPETSPSCSIDLPLRDSHIRTHRLTLSLSLSQSQANKDIQWAWLRQAQKHSQDI
jgi:hypothetical protein